MGANLDQTHAKLSHLSALLSEARRKRKSKVKAGPPKKKKDKKTRIAGKQDRNVLQKRAGRPPESSAPPTPSPTQRVTVRVRTPETASAPTRQPTAIPPAPEVKAPVTKPTEAPKAPETPKVSKAPKPLAAQRPAVPSARRDSLWQRIKKLTSLRRREAGIPETKPADQPTGEAPKPSGIRARVRGVLKRLAGLKRRFLGSDVEHSRTFRAMQLVEERSSTTFKKCKQGAMISSKTLRHSLNRHIFVNPDKKHPTFPIRAGCRASKGGVLRALQKDMSNAGEATVKQVLRRMNTGGSGGVRGKDTIHGWGTGVGGKRMETYRGKPHTPKRTKSLAKRLGISRKQAAKLYGISTGKPDLAKHTSPYSPPGGSKGPSGNREVRRASGRGERSRKKSKRSEKRRAASREVTHARGKALIGR